MIKETTYKSIIRLLIVTILVATVACSSEDTPLVSNEGDDTFTVIAEVARQLHSRGYQEDRYVRDGIYYLSYLLTDNNTYNVASVNFNKDGTTPGIGIVTVPDNQELKWVNIGGGSTPTFYLDNVNPNLAGAGSSLTKIIFDKDKPNPYKAAIFDKDEGTNDLLWGEKMEARYAKNVNFDLHHYMSRVRVQVTVDKTNEENAGDLDLNGAIVEISSLIQTPMSYDRTDGSLQLDINNEEAYTTLTLVNEAESAEEDAIIEWATSSQDEENANISVYTTHDFVLPPQGLLEDEKRPRLTIKLASGKVYSGILPHAMLIDDDIHNDPSYPAALYFLKEHILTIRTVITEQPPELAFMPVWVMKWVDKGDFTIEAHQSGIYKPKEFYDLIGYYNNNNDYQLVRYGYFNDETQQWTFDFFHSVTLDYDKIYNSMKPDGNEKKDFSFNFNNYAIYIQKGPDGTPILTRPQQLYNIVIGTETIQ